MPELQVLQSKTLTDPNTGITTRYMKLRIGDFEFETPYLASNLSDIKKAHELNTQLDSKMFQYYVDQTHPRTKPLIDITKRSSIINAFERIVNEINPKITGINFYYDSRLVDEITRRTSLDLQMELKTTFLSDMEYDRNQSANNFERQLDDFQSMQTEQIKCPTISLRTIDTQLFEEKIKLILSKGFKAFNVEWGGLGKYRQNFIILSRLLSQNDILCNFISTKPIRRYRAPLSSNLMAAGLIGATFISPGYVRPVGMPPTLPSPIGKLFNSANWLYEDATGPKSALHVQSMNLIFNTLQGIGANIRDGISLQDLYPPNYSL